MTDALNPAIPTSASQVEIAAELRGIKQRLVADKTAIENLLLAIEPLVDAGVTGLEILAAASKATVFETLEFEAPFVAMSTIPTLEDLKNYLGIASQNNESVEIGSDKGTIRWPGNTKLKWTIDVIPSSGSSTAVTWDNPFDQTVFFAGSLFFGSGGSNAVWVDGLNGLVGAYVDHGNASGHQVVTLALGI